MQKTGMMALGGLMSIALLSGCASSSYSDPYGQGSSVHYDSRYDNRHQSNRQMSDSGVIDSIQVSHEQRGGVSAGGVAGALIGGVLGNQIGSGSGRAVATVAGVVGGAMAGDHIDRRNDSNEPVYRIGVRLDGGGYQTITQDSAANLSVGTRVRVENGRVFRR